jgi:hypothetical protein
MLSRDQVAKGESCLQKILDSSLSSFGLMGAGMVHTHNLHNQQREEKKERHTVTTSASFNRAGMLLTSLLSCVVHQPECCSNAMNKSSLFRLGSLWVFYIWVMFVFVLILPRYLNCSVKFIPFCNIVEDDTLAMSLSEYMSNELISITKDSAAACRLGPFLQQPDAFISMQSKSYALLPPFDWKVFHKSYTLLMWIRLLF